MELARISRCLVSWGESGGKDRASSPRAVGARPRAPGLRPVPPGRGGRGGLRRQTGLSRRVLAPCSFPAFIVLPASVHAVIPEPRGQALC